MQIRRAQVHRRPLARSRTPWRHTSSKATPSLRPWRTPKKFIFYLRFWVRVRRARRVPPLRATVRLRLDIAMQIRRAHVHRRPLAYTAARSPTAARRGVTLQAKQHLPYVPGGPQKIYILLPFLGSCSPRSPCATTSRNCASDIAMQVRRVQAHHATPTHCNCCNGCAW